MDMEETKQLFDLLCETYRTQRKNGASPLTLAEKENDIWNRRQQLGASSDTNYPRVMGIDKRRWFTDQFGGNSSEYEIRTTLLLGGVHGRALFERIEGGSLKYHSAKKIYARAKELSVTNDMDMDITMRVVLKAYDGTGASLEAAKLPLGAKRAESEPPKFTPTEDVFDSKRDPTALSKQFKSSVMSTTYNYAEAMFAGQTISKAVKDRLIDDFRVSMDQLVDEWRRNLVVIKGNNRMDVISQLNREDFNWACEVLGISILPEGKTPKKGSRALFVSFKKPIDLKKINNRKVSRARDLHPDRNPSPEAVKEYDAVLKAYEVLKAYDKMYPTNGRKAKESK